MLMLHLRHVIFNFLHLKEVAFNFLVKFIYILDRDGIIENGNEERSVAGAPKLPFVTIFYKRTGKDRGRLRKASSRFSLVAHYGIYP